MMRLPDRLRALWQEAEAKCTSTAACAAQQEQWLDDYRRQWREALLENEHEDLRTGLFREVAAYYQIPEAEVERRCASALATLRHEWIVGRVQTLGPRSKISTRVQRLFTN